MKTDGTFSIRESKEPEEVPSLYVRADLMAVCPGDPRDKNYDLSIPPILVLKLCVAGQVIAHHSDSSGRCLFLISVSTFIGDMGEDPVPDSKYSTWRL